MYLIACPPHDQGFDSSVGEWMNLTVCPPGGPGLGRSVGEWMYLAVCPPCGPGSIPGHDGVFQGIFPWLITLCQPVLSHRGRKCLYLPSMAEVQPLTDNGWNNYKLTLNIRVLFWYGTLASPSLQIASAGSEHHGKNDGGPNQWIKVKITPPLPSRGE